MGSAEVAGRQALGHALGCACSRNGQAWRRAAELAAEAATYAAALGLPEQAYLALLQAALAAAQGGWRAAMPFWRACAEAAALLPDGLLVRLFHPHTALLAAAPADDALAQRLRGPLHVANPIRWHIRTLGAFSAVSPAKNASFRRCTGRCWCACSTLARPGAGG